MKTVLFLCTGNSCRSQMAEGLLRHLGGGEYEAFSAGIYPGRVNPMAIDAMKEIGIDISRQRSKSVDEFEGKEIDCVITVCDNAKESCPVFPGSRMLHWSIDDPFDTHGSHEAVAKKFAETRDLLAERIKAFMREFE
jgi:arsenate reductase (thioredoxin)